MIITPTTVDSQRGLQQLHDRTEITDLVHRLGACLDGGRYDEMRELLTEDATVTTPGGHAEGREALIAQARRNHPDGQRFQHVITNVLIDLEDDRAEVRANLVVHITTSDEAIGDAPAPPPRCSIGEVYSFEFVRAPGGWRFSRIATVALWVSGNLPTRAGAA